MSPIRPPFRLPAIAAVSALLALMASSRADGPPAEQSVDAPHGMRLAVKMIGPVTQQTDLQVICVLAHDPAGDKYVEAMADFNGKLGGLLSGIRDRGEFAGAAGETLLFTPPPGTVAAKRVLLIGVGNEASLSLAQLQVTGRIAAREALRLGAEHVSFAPALRDQGSKRVDVGDGDGAFAEQVVLAYDTAKRMQAQGLSPKADIADLTIEAGPKFFRSACDKVQAAVVAATEQVSHRTGAAYAAGGGK